MRAVIVAGGRGLRLRPFTTCIPKPLVPIGDETPILAVLLCQLRRAGVHRVSLALGHKGDLIANYVGDGANWDLEVDYWTEDRPLGTVGPLLGHLDELPQRFLLLNGDVLCDIDFADLMSFHVAQSAQLTLAAHKRRLDIDFGVLEVRDSRLQGFSEKPSYDYRVNMGIYAVSRDVLSGFDAGSALGVDQLVESMLADGRHPCSYDFTGYWRDIGRPEDYDLANAEFAAMRPRLLGPQLTQLIGTGRTRVDGRGVANHDADRVITPITDLDTKKAAGVPAQPRKRVTA